MAHNRRTLKVMSLIGTVLFLIFCFSPLFFEGKPHKVWAFVSFAAGAFALYLYARFIARDDWQGSVRAGYVAFFVLAVFAGLYIGVLEDRQSAAVTYMTILLCAQCLFTMPAALNLFLNLASLLVFVSLVQWLKPPNIALLDTLNVLFPTVISLVLSWYLSSVRVQGIITEQKLGAEGKRFLHQSSTDELTGLANRRGFTEAIAQHLATGLRMRQTVCAAILDVDHFKDYNDHYGHPMGDEVLMRIGQALSVLGVETGAFPARIGGEEFVLLWLENRMAVSESIALMACERIAMLEMEHCCSPVAEHVTVSIGMCAVPSWEPLSGPQDLYSMMDRALYAAKRAGRNRVMRYDTQHGAFMSVTREAIEQKEPLPALDRRQGHLLAEPVCAEDAVDTLKGR